MKINDKEDRKHIAIRERILLCRCLVILPNK